MFDISGPITTQGRASFDILNFGDGGPNGGGTIGGDATVNISANSLTTTTTNGDANFAIYNNSLGSIGGNAMISLNLTGDLTAQGVANFTIGNSNGGTIGSDAMIDMTAHSASTGGALNAENGNIGGTASIDFSASENITTQGYGLFAINNSVGAGETAGTIGADALLSLHAVNISMGVLDAQIYNPGGGNIVGNANLSLTLT